MSTRFLTGPETGSRRLDGGDRILITILTLLYTVVTLLNLGTMNFPTTSYRMQSAETVVFDFGQETDIGEIWFNSNIGEGRLLLTDERGQTFEYSEDYDNMFSWVKHSVLFHTRYLSATLDYGTVALNEIVFCDLAGETVVPTIQTDDPALYALIDEPSTKAESNYLNGMYFDEIYHARTAYEFLHGMSVYEWTHPPLGKAIIALGITIFAMTPFGWRVMPALFGAAMLPVLFVLGKRLFRRRDLAFLAAALFALDTMHFAQTRIATVDVFIVFFILLMYLFMTDFLQKDFCRDSFGSVLLPLGACGVSFGLGVAAKWTGLYAGAGLALLFFAHLIRQGIRVRREPALRKVYGRRTILTLLFCCAFFLLIPAIIYFLSYTPFYRYEAQLRGGNYGFADKLATLIAQQQSMYAYHSNLQATHLCESAWYQWPLTAKSVWFYHTAENGITSNISSVGSPAIWWVASIGFFMLLTEAAFRRVNNRSAEYKRAAVIVTVGVAANLLPWLLVTRCTFQYHFFPTVPFIILAALLLVQHLEEEGELPPWVKWAWAALALVYFVLLLPAISGLPIRDSYAYFLEHILPTGLLFQGTI